MRSGVILAGGESSRIGRDKGLLEFRGKTLLSWVVDVLSNIVDELAISVAVNRKEEYSKHLVCIEKSHIKIIEDETSFYGPLGGLLSSFPHLHGEYVAVAPCDSPFIASGFYPLLFEKAQGCDGAVPKIKNNYEPLHAVYKRVPMIQAMETIVKQGKHKPIETYDYLKIHELNEDILIGLDPELRSFLNINTLEEHRIFEAGFYNPI